MSMAYRLHSAQERRVAPRLRFLTSPLPFGGLAPLKETSGEDMERWWWKEKKADCANLATYMILVYHTNDKT